MRLGEVKSKTMPMSYQIEDYLVEIGRYARLVDEVHSVGGLHPDWDVEYYESLIAAAKQRYPEIAIKALTAVEIKHLSQQSNISFVETLNGSRKQDLTLYLAGEPKSSTTK